jgi:hypothetical protein
MAGSLILASVAQAHALRRQRRPAPSCPPMDYGPYYKPITDQGNNYYYSHKCGSDTPPWTYMTVTDGTTYHNMCNPGDCVNVLNNGGAGCDTIGPFGYPTCFRPGGMSWDDPEQQGFCASIRLKDYYHNEPPNLTTADSTVNWDIHSDVVYWDHGNERLYAKLVDITWGSSGQYLARIGLQMKEGGTVKHDLYGVGYAGNSHQIRRGPNLPVYHVHMYKYS